MPLKTDSVEEPNINLTPMIDIVFLLVIFFMVGARFSELERRFDVKVPTIADVATESDEPDALVVNVTEAGVIEFNGNELSADELEKELRRAHEAYPKQAVVVRGDREGRYQAVMDVLGATKRAGIEHISLAHRSGREASP